MSKPSEYARKLELFRRIHGKVVPRTAVEGVVRQKDPMKRGWDARKQLSAEGTLILGRQGDDPIIATKRGFPPPKKGEFLALPVDEDRDAYWGSVK